MFSSVLCQEGRYKKSDLHRRHGHRKKGEKGVEDKEREREKKSDNNLLFVVTATKLVMKPEPGSSCLSGSGVSSRGC